MNVFAQKAPGSVALHKRVANLIGRQVMPRSPSRLRLSEFILLNPLVFSLWFHGRRLYWRLRGYKLRTLEMGQGFVGEKALPYNLSNIGIINRARTERLMWLMRAIQGFDRENAKMLVVGPRNEAELLLLRGYGFPLKNLTAIDLFSYSPTIRLMDMHALQYPDDSFDAVYSSFVITYSDDIPKAVEETVRVARSGAFIIFAFQHLRPGAGNALGVNRLQGGTAELYQLFGDRIGQHLWSENCEQSDGSRICSMIFQIRKHVKQDRD